LEMRYFGQNHELEVAIAFDEFNEETIASAWESFHAAHKARYNFDIPGETIELISIKITALSATGKPVLPTLAKGKGAPKPIGTRKVVFDDGEHETAVYDRATLLGGQSFTGPAVIEEPASVTVVRPGMAVRVDEYGHLLLGNIAEA